MRALSREFERSSRHVDRVLPANFGLELGCAGALVRLLLLELALFLRSQLNHSLQHSLLETKVFHRHIVHHLHVLLQQSIQVLDQTTARRLLPESLPVLESVAGGGPIV